MYPTHPIPHRTGTLCPPTTPFRSGRCARRRPIVDLPTPISPTSTIGCARIAAGMADAGLFGFRAMVRAAIPPEARGTMVFGARDEPRVVGILRTSGRSGTGRWVGRLVVLALLLVAFVLLLDRKGVV